MNIPIENIYYLLCYAWDKLEEKDRVAVSIDDNTTLLDLFVKVLINATRILLKRGIDRNYMPQTAELAGVKGKFELSQTLKSRLHLKKRTVCSFDDFSANVLTNRILVSTFSRLMRIKGLDPILKSDIRRIKIMFGVIDEITLTSDLFGQIRLHRNNKFYDFVLKVCHLIYENTLPAENTGEWKFADFSRDEKKMAKLFEAFVRNFYRIETGFRVRSENIQWQFSVDDVSGISYLPHMFTDTTLENEREKIIIETKFYKETMAINYERERIKSANLYQLFSYLLNQENENHKTINARGILLYPTIEKEHDLHFKYKTHDIFLKTVNLNTNWKNISKRLVSLIRSADQQKESGLCRTRE